MVISLDVEGDERAQLILVGAVAIAFIVLGLAVVFNTVLYTENVASTGAESAPRDAQQAAAELSVDSARLAEKVSANGQWVTDTEAYQALERNISDYRDGMGKVLGASTSAVVSFEEGSQADAEFGVRIQQTGGSNFRAPGGAKNWSLTPAPNDAIYRDFDMTVDRAGLERGEQDKAFHIIWEDSSDPNNNYVLWVYEKDSTNEVAIRTVNDSANPDTDFSGSECVLPGSDSASSVTFNFSDGTVEGYDACDSQIGAWASLDNETNRRVWFYRADNVTGSYSVVINDQPATNPTIPIPSLAGADDPFRTVAVWEYELSVRYESGSVSYTDTVIVEVYNRSR